MVVINNGILAAAIDTQGAALKSLRVLQNDLELMWRGDPKFWGKTSPVLFPIVGSLVNGQYRIAGKSYSLPRHGFARDQSFEVIRQTQDSVVLELKDSPYTQSIYPFSFSLQLQYTLKESAISLNYQVTNTGETPLWFCIGGHPAFAMPILPNTLFEDYYLYFSDDDWLDRLPLENGLLLPNSERIDLDQGKLWLHKSLFNRDALVFTQLQSRAIQIGHRNRGPLLNFQYLGFPHFGIWSAPKADFVCLEPWQGHTDFVDFGSDFSKKAGVIELPVGHTWSKSWQIIPYPEITF